MNTIEEDLDAAWQDVARQRDEVVGGGGDRIRATMQRELDVLLQSVRQSLCGDQPALEAGVAKLMRMAEQFREGVELWHTKAKSGVRNIEEKQRALGLLVQDAAIRTAARREDFLQRQRQRSSDTQEKCERLLRVAELDAV